MAAIGATQMRITITDGILTARVATVLAKRATVRFIVQVTIAVAIRVTLTVTVRVIAFYLC